MDNFKILKELIATAEKDAASFYEKGNSAAGTRLRLTLQQVKVSATAIRQEIVEKKRRK
ncbi:hypothetical protein SAMN05216490_2834 [Mucilaginibacter mallensis]|uniref:Histone H1-like protein Hc1 n=1 Tax=Mucilaginibacter mallensis TaxID=652787 RepID=A0A1H1YSI9_MUCMA|nr:histone H1 [Mucilaginibacter mallensis]SDT24343.1 hypothetical protein SAMN05216490_2834 [Mucilaginibacter mallensis]